jgi:hypothetical protein
MRLLDGRWVRVRTGTLAVCALAFAGGSVNGAAENAGPPPDLAPPFTFGYRTETSSIVLPCREVPNAPGSGTLSDPATGQVHIGVAADGQECTSLAHDVSEVWALGAAPESLVGHPAHVKVVYLPDAFDSQGQGDATVGGGVFLSVGGSPEWPLGSFRCSAGTCNPATPEAQDGRIVLEGDTGMLPAQVEAEYRAEAFVKRGTGKASVSLSGRLESVTFGPAEDDQTVP